MSQASQTNEFNIITSKPINLSAFTQVRYQNLEDKNDSFDIRRTRTSLKGKISKRLKYRLQTEFGGSSQKLLDAELTFDIHPMINLSVGQFKIPFSNENLTSAAYLEFINWSQVVSALTARSKDVIGNYCGRDIGIKLYGNLSNLTNFEYSIGIFNGSGINTVDLNEEKDIIARTALHPLKYLTLGSSFYYGKYTLTNTLDKILARERIGADLSYQSNNISLKAEYIHGKDDIVEKAGWFVQAGYFLFPDKFQSLLKYDTYDPDTHVSNNSTNIYTVGFNYYFDKKSKIQVNYEIIDEQCQEKENNALIAQLQFAL